MKETPMDLNEKTPLDLRIEELEAQLAAAKEARRKQAEDLRKSVEPVMSYSVRPVEDAHRDVYPDSGVLLYRVEAECLNLDECRAVGRSVDQHGKGMTYLWNTHTSTIVCDSGGGYVFIGFSHDREEAHFEAIRALGEFIGDNPDGGDVTAIVEAYERASDKRRY